MKSGQGGARRRTLVQGTWLQRSASLAGLALVAQAVGIGCSNSAPPAPQGALTFSFGTALGSQRGCRLRSFTKNLGTVDAANVAPLTDGGGSAAVKCRISPAGNGFQVDASLTSGINQFSLSGQVSATGDSSVLANVTTDETQSSFASGSPATASKPDAAKPCVVSFPAASAGTGGAASASALGISAGRVWGKLVCDDLRDAQDPTGTVCAITSGYFFFDSCDD